MKNSFRFTTLAGAIALAMGTVGVANAAPPSNALPGQGHATLGTATGAITGTPAAPILTITQAAGAPGGTVIDWGKGGADINASGTGGFNIGSKASVAFDGSGGVLNVDVSGNPSQIFGKLDGGGEALFVANANGIVVGAGATIESAGAEVGLIGANLGDVSAFDGTLGTIPFGADSGSVSVAKGAHLSGSTVLVAGGTSVNVDLSALNASASGVRLMAGEVNGSKAGVAKPNKSASLAVAGTPAGSAISAFESAGNASIAKSADVDLTGVASGSLVVGGTLTNAGTLALPILAKGSKSSIADLANAGTVNGSSDLAVGTLTNTGTINLATGGTLETLSGGLTNSGKIVGAGATSIGAVSVASGDFVNNGQISGSGSLKVTNGNLTNNGTLIGFSTLATTSDKTGSGFKKGADYSITNSGTIRAGASLTLSANLAGSGAATTPTDSTGSINNQGALQVNSGAGVTLRANNDVTLDGKIQRLVMGTTYAATSFQHKLASLDVEGGNANTASGSFGAKTGNVTVGTNVVSEDTTLAGYQVAVMANVGGSGGSGLPSGAVTVYAGGVPSGADVSNATNSLYAVRVGAGDTLQGQTVNVTGIGSGDQPNVILQGSILGNAVTLGWAGSHGAVGDVFTGPNGGITVSQLYIDAEGLGSSTPTLTIESTGRVKTAPYLNDANFRFNDLPVTVLGGSFAPGSGTVNLKLNPNPTGDTSDMQGDPKAGINLLVNGSVNLIDTLDAATAGAPSAGGTSVIGVGDVANTHLVLQSTGNISVGGAFGVGPGPASAPVTAGDFYWPGYLYLGNIQSDADGNPLPGTLGLGQITATGDVNNVVPGSTANGTGIHFMTSFPLTLAGDVITNDNAWVNFATQQLVDGYSSGNLSAKKFFGGAVTSGKVITYGPLGKGNFVLQEVNSTR